MFHEICITVTMRLVAFGHPLDRTFARVEERFAFFSSLTSDEVRDLAGLRMRFPDQDPVRDHCSLRAEDAAHPCRH